MSSRPSTDPDRLATGPAGPLLALAAFGLYASHDVLIRILGETYSVFQIVFFMGLLSFPLVIVLMIRDPLPGTLKPVHPWWTLARTLAAVTSASSAFYAFTVMPLAQVYSVLFATPLLVTVLAIPLLGEKVGLHRGLAVCFGLIGVIIVLRPGAADLSLGHVAALFAALLSALNSVIVRKISRAERSAVLMLYPMLANVMVMGALLPAVWVPLQLKDLGILVVIAMLGFAAMLLTIAAFRRAEAALVAPMQYSQILWAVFYGALLFDESPDGWTIVGVSVIIASGLYIVFRESRRNVSAHQPVLNAPTRPGTTQAPQNNGGPAPTPGP